MEERVPEIRFKEYKEPWKKRKLIEAVSSIDTGKSKFNASKIGKYEILGSTSVIGFDNEYDYEGDFILTARVGANAGELYRHSGKVKISDNTFFIQGTQLDFIFRALQHLDIKKLSFGTGQPLVKASELKEQVIPMPTSDIERTLIGGWFCKLDALITLNQQKLDKLKTLKKSCLEKMFPKDGETVPEVRFKGFEGPWERKTLGDLMSLGNGRDYKHLQYGSVPVYGTGGYMTSVNDSLCDKDSIGIGRKGTIDKPYILKAPFWTVDTLFYATPKEGVDLYYLFGLFQIIDWKSKDESTGVPSLSKQNINGIETYSSSNILEQRKIGIFFNKLDNDIELLHQKLDKLKFLKQACLEKMFV